MRQPVEMGLRSCYCCGKPGHLSKDCVLKSKYWDICNRKKHTMNACRMVKDEVDQEVEMEDAANDVAKHEKKSFVPILAMKLRLSFTNGTKKDQT